ncbi:MAG: MBL fold metallo-hydrolase [Candidatus Spechtbacterales bacterium]
MVITWYGQACFKIQSGPLSLIIDPFEQKIGLTPPKIEAQLVLVTHDHYDHNNIATVKGNPFVVDGPGEFEYQGVRILGVPSFHDNVEGKERGLNTIYAMDIEGMRLVHLGDIGQDKLIDEQIEALGTVNILLVPVGGVFTVNAEHAIEIVNQVGPQLVIPMHYKVKGLKVELEDASAFLKEIGHPDAAPQDKLTVKKKDLPEERTDVVVMKV